MDDFSIFAGLRKKDNSSFKVLYEYYYPTIEKLVLSNSGSIADAEDVFQDTLIVLLDKVPAEDFKLTASIKTYVYAVASNIWLKRLRKNGRNVLLDSEVEVEDLTLQEWELREEKSIAKSRILKIMRIVTRHCMVFLTKSFLRGLTREKLMEELGYKNEHTFDNQKYKCLQQARRNFSTIG